MARFLALVLVLILASSRAFAAEPVMPEEAPGTVHATAAKGNVVKGLSWLEIGTFSPAYHPVDEAFIKRMEATWHLKLRAFRRNAAIPAHFNFDPKLRAQWKKIVEECTRIIKGK